MAPKIRGSEGAPYGIEQRPQRQDAVTDQLKDLHIVAARLGMHDAADWLWKHAPEGTWPR